MYFGMTFFNLFSSYISHHVYRWLCLQYNYCTYLVLFVEESRRRWEGDGALVVNKNNKRKNK